ncbi:hypothetical protein [Pedobacter sp. Leaf250]|uniref:hypothetical protein n=1 Tax=Pedobacter sp. Leaf250 TaxID=2876559 RepID=UPI001E5AB947|nr:hypothetical protein [Pedobacter sp. Leaf250]
MRNRYLLLAFAVMISSCSIFKDKSKSKEKVFLDSTVNRTLFSKSIDTGKITHYEKLTLYFQPGTMPAPNKENDDNIFNFAAGLMDAARGLANASVSLQDSTKESAAPPGTTKKKVQKSSPGLLNLPGLLAAAFEKGSSETKGKTDERSEAEQAHVNKDTNKTDTDNKANAKGMVIGSVLIYFVIAIVLIGLFLWIKSRR